MRTKICISLIALWVIALCAFDVLTLERMLGPGKARTYNNLGNFYLHQGEFEKARGCYKTGIYRDPNFPDCYLDLGVSYEFEGKYKDAETCYRQAIIIAPGFSTAHLFLGNALFQSGQIKEAIQSYRKAIELGEGEKAKEFLQIALNVEARKI